MKRENKFKTNIKIIQNLIKEKLIFSLNKKF